MKKTLKLKKDEPLHAWLDRISKYYDTHEVCTAEFRDIIREVSIQSYIHGSNDAQQVYSGMFARKGGQP